MPSLSPTMEKGNLAKWRKKEGDKVNPGDILAEVETDKATVDFEMQESGFVAKLLVPEGAKDISIGDMVAILVDKKEDVAAFKDFTLSGGSAAPTPKASKPAEEVKAAPAAAPTQSPSTSNQTQATPQTGDRLFASPFAQKIAKEKGVNLSEISGTGPKGRIIAADVNEFKPKEAAAQATTQAIPQAPASSSFDDIPLTQMRKVIAQRLSLSKTTIPHYYVTVE
jgi:pyruvate dehydrogenase E2 component (dihydrolipoamide acetyltransferase)